MSRRRFPFGIPSGWYAVATSGEVKPGQIVRRKYFEREIAMYRTESGALAVVDVHCPHLGGNLAKLGRVEGDVLRCGFHGFRYAIDGRCVSTEYGSPPPNDARLGTWEFREVDGLIFVWFHPQGDLPDWEPPLLDNEGWSAIRFKKYEIDTHPQETTENSVDFGHFTKLHGFVDGSMTRSLRTDGPFLYASYEAYREYLGWRVLVEYDVKVAGLGYSQVDVRIDQLGLQLRVFVLPVPLDGEHIELRLGMASRRIPGLTTLVRRISHLILCREVDQDLDAWEYKAYLEAPALAKGDGPIGTYRRWASQFYAD